MAESRYGIMEELNQKKLNARNNLANLEKEIEIGIMQTEENTQQIKKEINDENSNYKDDHKNFIRNQEMLITNKTREFERKIEQIKIDIIQAEETYEDKHKALIEEKEKKLKELELGHQRWKKIKEMEVTSIKEEINEIGKAIESLKEISKEQKKE